MNLKSKAESVRIASCRRNFSFHHRWRSLCCLGMEDHRFLNYFDHADDIRLSSHWVMGLVQMVLVLERGLGRARTEDKQIKINIFSICVNRQNIEGVKQFVYVGSVVSAIVSTELDIARHVEKAYIFCFCCFVWKSESAAISIAASSWGCSS